MRGRIGWRSPDDEEGHRCCTFCDYRKIEFIDGALFINDEPFDTSLLHPTEPEIWVHIHPHIKG